MKIVFGMYTAKQMTATCLALLLLSGPFGGAPHCDPWSSLQMLLVSA
jgi:hypothetical protein